MVNKDRISITDLSKLKITKVKYYKSTFKYDDHDYLLINESDDDCCISLYERVWVAKDRVMLKHINTAITNKSVGDLFKDISKGRPTSLVYSNVDRMYFAKMLVELGFSDGIGYKEFQYLTETEDSLRKQIIELQNAISSLYKDWREQSGRGSKQYGIELKTRVAERVKGASRGEYCKEYDANYGDSHPIYGGELVDLFNIPVGESFYVLNGQYSAFIGVDEHGDKCVVTSESVVKLTEEHHSSYIDKQED